MVFENFVTTDENRVALDYAKRVAEGKGFRILFLAGGTAVGKTHLLTAIAHHLAEHSPDKNVVFATAEKLTNDYVAWLRAKGVDEFRQKYSGADVLLIDDLQFLEGREGTQQQFFNTLDELQRAGKAVVLAANRVPGEIDMEERYRSRLSSGLVYNILPPDTQGRVAMLRQWAGEMGVAVDKECIAMIAEPESLDPRMLKGIVIRLGAYSELAARPIDCEMVEHALRDMGGPKVVPPAVFEEGPVPDFEVDEELVIALGDALEDGDPTSMAKAMSDLALAVGAAEIARKSGIELDDIYELISEDGSPAFATVQRLVHSLGLKLCVSA